MTDIPNIPKFTGPAKPDSLSSKSSPQKPVGLPKLSDLQDPVALSEQKPQTPREKLEQFLKIAVQNEASDIHFVSNKKTRLRIKDKLVPVGGVLSREALKDLLFSALDEDQKLFFNENKEIDFGLQIPDLGRFRVNMFTALDDVEAVLRLIKKDIKGSKDD